MQSGFFQGGIQVSEYEYDFSLTQSGSSISGERVRQSVDLCA
jgi:hypothetical protein